MVYLKFWWQIPLSLIIYIWSVSTFSISLCQSSHHIGRVGRTSTLLYKCGRLSVQTLIRSCLSFWKWHASLFAEHMLLKGDNTHIFIPPPRNDIIGVLLSNHPNNVVSVTLYTPFSGFSWDLKIDRKYYHYLKMCMWFARYASFCCIEWFRTDFVLFGI